MMEAGDNDPRTLLSKTNAKESADENYQYIDFTCLFLILKTKHQSSS
jgi:hypothetical protein